MFARAVLCQCSSMGRQTHKGCGSGCPANRGSFGIWAKKCTMHNGPLILPGGPHEAGVGSSRSVHVHAKLFLRKALTFSRCSLSFFSVLSCFCVSTRFRFALQISPSKQLTASSSNSNLHLPPRCSNSKSNSVPVCGSAMTLLATAARKTLKEAKSSFPGREPPDLEQATLRIHPNHCSPSFSSKLVATIKQ